MLYDSAAELAMGRWVMGQWVKWVTFLDGSHGSWVEAW